MDLRTVLCIDDRPQALELRKATLESQGYSVKIAPSGFTAIKMLAEMSVVAVLLEYKHDGMDAEAVACHIKQRFPNLPIILISAYYEMPERILWLVDDYVMKSELPERLVPIIERTQKLGPRSTEPLQDGSRAALKERPECAAYPRQREYPHPPPPSKNTAKRIINTVSIVVTSLVRGSWTDLCKRHLIFSTTTYGIGGQDACLSTLDRI
jgi:CheY-like chemotaxis protein